MLVLEWAQRVARLLQELELRDLLGDVIEDRLLLALDPLVRLDATQRFLQVFPLTHCDGLVYRA
jgi:hypothetical protein